MNQFQSQTLWSVQIEIPVETTSLLKYPTIIVTVLHWKSETSANICALWKNFHHETIICLYFIILNTFRGHIRGINNFRNDITCGKKTANIDQWHTVGWCVSGNVRITFYLLNQIWEEFLFPCRRFIGRCDTDSI